MQFDLHRLEGGLRAVDLQSDLIGLRATRLVAPLREAEAYPELPGLTPAVEVEGRRFVVQVPDMAAVPARALGPAVGELGAWRDELLRAVDILTRGF